MGGQKERKGKALADALDGRHGVGRSGGQAGRQAGKDIRTMAELLVYSCGKTEGEQGLTLLMVLQVLSTRGATWLASTSPSD